MNKHGYTKENAMKEDPLVSVVIPMYNVGEYAVACLRSVIGQDYANLEIIVVNDGSTDQTLRLCTKELAREPRAAIYSKDNGGLSSARNYGLERAKGKYVTFVDGDDVLAPQAVKTLVRIAERESAPLSICGYSKIRSSSDFRTIDGCSWKKISGKELLRRLLCLDGESGSACGKLFREDIYSNLQFPVGQLFEDFGVIAEVFSSIEYAAVVNEPLYGYVTREGSITTEKSYTSKHIDGMIQSLNRVNNVLNKYSDLRPLYEQYKAICYLRVAARLPEDNKINDEFVRITRLLSKDVKANKTLSAMWRIRFTLFAISPKIYSRAFSVYARISGKAVA